MMKILRKSQGRKKEIMKLYQLYVRKGKLQEAMSLRKQAIEGQAGGDS